MSGYFDWFIAKFYKAQCVRQDDSLLTAVFAGQLCKL